VNWTLLELIAGRARRAIFTTTHRRLVSWLSFFSFSFIVVIVIGASCEAEQLQDS
jgi:hypothetical protein